MSPTGRSTCPAPTAPGPHVAPVSDTWELRPGVWFPSTAPVTSVTHEAGPACGCELIFRGNAAALWRQPVRPGASGQLAVSATVDAAAGDKEGLSWVSVMLTTQRQSQGWVTAPEHMMGLLVRSNGAIQLFSGGREIGAVWSDGSPAPADSYRVELQLRVVEGPGTQTLTLSGSVGGKAMTAELASGPEATLPPESHLLVGAHFHPEDPMRSRVSATSGSW